MEILHTHEELVKKLHRAIVYSGIHPRYDEPRRRHVRWKSLDLTSSRRGTGHRKRQSLGGAGSAKGDIFEFTATPSETADVVNVFRDMMSRFFAYEEYSAKYEMMLKDVASTYKSVSGWSAYEMGLEALATSLASINNRERECRKALTVADLLIKPIQRICKYPLFFAELLKQTPVFDCPESHADIEKAYDCMRETVREINKAGADKVSKARIQRAWLLEEKLVFGENVSLHCFKSYIR
jgi:hypothetical protein